MQKFSPQILRIELEVANVIASGAQMKPFFAFIKELINDVHSSTSSHQLNEQSTEQSSRKLCFAVINILIAMLSSAASSCGREKESAKVEEEWTLDKLGFRQMFYLVKENALLSNAVRSLDKDVSKTRKPHANAKQREHGHRRSILCF
ncbi:hypothetical protein HN51_028928 [Arachis hypogaea]|uniref:uncharacterized protein isoform X1 n=1 Tax=Arachis hypogaea TaxID=3818 RepID=UPI0034E78A20